VNKTLKPGWSYKKLNELGFVGRGKSKHRPRNEPSLYGGKHPFIQTAEVTASEFYIIKYSQTYSDLGLAQSKLWDKNTLCIVNAGENTAETAILKFKACFPDSIIGFIANSEKADVRFIKYYLTTIKPQLRSITKGATQDNLSVSKLLLFDILTPPLPTQRKIAAILSAYDDLIENNTRRIEILEEMARSIYREWFVKFRFPGHEQVQMVDSELGLIPEGWEVGKLGDVSCVIPGYAFKSKDWQKTGIPVIKIKNINADNTVDLQKTDFVSQSILTPKIKKYLLKGGEFLIAMTGATAGKVGKLRTKEPMLLNQRVAKIEPLPNYRSYIWQIISSEEGQNRFFKLADGAAQPNMSGLQIEEVRIILPSLSLCIDFDSIVNDIYRQIDNFIFRNQTLRQTRDLLLPRLISGEIDVENLDINTGSIAA